MLTKVAYHIQAQNKKEPTIKNSRFFFYFFFIFLIILETKKPIKITIIRKVIKPVGLKVII